MAWKNLAEFVEKLECEGLLKRVSFLTNPDREMTEIADRMIGKGEKALLFENTGYDFPVLMNAFAGDRLMNVALGLRDMDQPGEEMQALLKKLAAARGGWREKWGALGVLQAAAAWMPRVIRGKAQCQEVVMETPDMTRLPVLKCWPYDGGPFVTLPVVHTVDPETGARNAGMYRMQVFGPQLCGMHWHLHKDSAHHFRKYKEQRKRMPVSVTLGGDPAYTYAATAPLPADIDEMMLAGFLRKKKVALVKCLTNDLLVPADADFIIEGYIDPDEALILEGPFGDHTGFYSLADEYPRFHITCISHRQNAIYPATVVGIPPKEDAWLGKATERIFLFPIRASVVPEMLDIHMPQEGVFHNVVLVRIRQSYTGQARKVMNALWGAGQMMFNKFLIVVNEDVELTDYRQVLRAVMFRVDLLRDLCFSQGPADVLDHSSQRFAYGGKLGIDATLEENLQAKDDGFGVDQRTTLNEKFPEAGLVQPFPEYSLLLVFIDNPGRDRLRAIHSEMVDVCGKQAPRFVVFLDRQACDLPLPALIWLAANHTDPGCDCFLSGSSTGTASLGIDALSKNRALDDFNREWPNPVVMDRATIDRIDAVWEKLGLGPFIVSPSIPYEPLVNGAGAVRLEGED